MEQITLDCFRPQMVCQIMDEEFGALGYLVIDRTVGANPCGGGIRFAPGLTVEEIAQLARVMTLKFSFLNFPHGGAKAGITVPAPLFAQHRGRVMAAFGKSMGILLKRNVYFTGEDMGTTIDDINIIQQVLGNPPYLSSSDSIAYTALTVFEVIRQSVFHRGLKFSSLTAAIEGFGKVGSELAVLLANEGASIRAVSTAAGALYRSSGLDVGAMVSLRQTYGDSFVQHMKGADRIDRADVLTQDVDLLIPCARTWSIHIGNAARVKASLIVPAANAPVTPGAEQVLARKGVLYVPDFVANCGAVLSSRMSSLGFSDAVIRQTIQEVFAGKVARLLEVARHKGISPLQFARMIAWRNFHKMNEKAAPSLPGNTDSGRLSGKIRETLSAMRKKARLLTRTEDDQQAAFSRFAQRLVGAITVYPSE